MSARITCSRNEGLLKRLFCSSEGQATDVRYSTGRRAMEIQGFKLRALLFVYRGIIPKQCLRSTPHVPSRGRVASTTQHLPV